MTTLPAKDNSKALAAYMALKVKIDIMLARLTDTQTRILTAGTQRPGFLAMPLPRGLHGAAAKKVVGMLMGRKRIQQVDANIRKGAPLWRETGDGHGTTLVVTKTGLAAIGFKPGAVETKAHVRKTPKTPKPPAAPKTPRTITKHARLIKMLEAPDRANIAEIVAATDWQPHTIRGAISGVLKKNLGLNFASEKTGNRGRVYKIHT
jgi:hypothetical protein